MVLADVDSTRDVRYPQTYVLVVLLPRVLVSELSGQSNILSKVEESGMASKAELKASHVWRERLGQVRRWSPIVLNQKWSSKSLMRMNMHEAMAHALLRCLPKCSPLLIL